MNRQTISSSLLTLFVLILVFSAILASLFLMLVLMPRLNTYFEAQIREDLILATTLAAEICDESFEELLRLRLSEEPTMVETLRRESLRQINTLDEEFGFIDIAVLQEGAVPVRAADLSAREVLAISALAVKSPESVQLLAVERRPLIYWTYFPFWRWRIVSYIPLESARGPLNMVRRVVLMSMAGTLGSIVTALILSYVLLIRRPLLMVMEGARRVAAGTIQPIAVVRRDELGSLAVSFNAMVASLKEKEATIATTMSDLQKSLKEKEILLQEVHHRVRNNLNVIVSLLNLRSQNLKTTDDAVKAFLESKERIRTIAMIHGMLYESGDYGHIRIDEYLSQLVNHLEQIYHTQEQVTINFDIDPIRLDLTKAIPFSLIVNEILTNAFKHAFPDDRSGRINLILKAEESSGRILFSISDDGVGFSEDITESGQTLGMMLIRELTAQIAGRLEIGHEKNGTYVSISFDP